MTHRLRRLVPRELATAPAPGWPKRLPCLGPLCDGRRDRWAAGPDDRVCKRCRFEIRRLESQGD